MVRVSAIQELDQLVILVDDLGEDGGILAGFDQFVDGFVEGGVVRRERWTWVQVLRQLLQILGKILRVCGMIEGIGNPGGSFKGAGLQPLGGNRIGGELKGLV